MSQIIFFNGRYLPLKKAGISPRDLGLIRGYGVFDVMKIVNGKPFLLWPHWERLKKSAKLLNLIAPVNDQSYEKIVSKLIKLAKARKNYIIRTVLTGGPSADGLTPEGRETFYVLIEKLKSLPQIAYEKGVKVITCDYQREYPQSKITNYVTAIKNLERKKQAGAHEIIYVNQGVVKEGALSNFFIVKRNVLITPKKNILIGITRNLVIKLARQARLRVSERDVKISEFMKADEMFLTNTTRGIVPVVRVNSKKIGNGMPGEITKSLMKKFDEFVKNY